MMRHMLRRAARRLAGRAPAAMHGVNNAISVFTDASSRFLTSLGEHLRFPLITSVGLLSPWLLHDIATGRRELARRHMRDFGYPVRAANLCLSARGGRFGRVVVSDELYHRVVTRLLATNGRILNDLLPASAPTLPSTDAP